SRGPHAATTRRHGTGAGRTPQQEHRGRFGHQPACGREPPRLDHEENRIEVAPCAGPTGVSSIGRRGRTATSGLGRRVGLYGPPCAYFFVVGTIGGLERSHG